MRSFNKYLTEEQALRIKKTFVDAAARLLENDPYISFWDLLAEHKVIPPIRGPRPTPKQIEDAGYRHDGKGNIIGKHRRILKGCTGNKDQYKRHNLRVPGFGRNGEWTPQEHTLIFALVHRRWPRDGMVIDHIDGDPRNNHPDNLREVTNRENNPHVKRESNTIKPIKTNNINTHTNLLDFFNDGTI
jgi:hypothetical protein|tara:strand:+ start:47 stop:607 length:561 start_codon:yes stop_codon:yes gene_type:complete